MEICEEQRCTLERKMVEYEQENYTLLEINSNKTLKEKLFLNKKEKFFIKNM